MLVDDVHGYPLAIQPTIPASDVELARREEAKVTSNARSRAIIVSLVMATGVSSMLNGLVTIILPTIQHELELGPELLIWPIAITSLTCGCTLLLAGSICDAVGSKPMYIMGSLFQAGFVLGSGLARNGFEMILFRGLSGIGISFCLPSTTSIITSMFHGPKRNMAFAFMGAGQPVGFAVGLVLAGVLTEYYTWRIGFYVGAGIIASTAGLVLWAAPSTANSLLTWRQKWDQIIRDVDWMGAMLASASLGLSSYAFANITGDTSHIKDISTVLPLAISLSIVPIFLLWVDRQERLGRPALIPNSVWRNRYFSTICLTVFLAWGTFNSIETLLTLFFQEVQKLGPLQTSLRFIPVAVAGTIMELVAGKLVHVVSAHVLVNLGLFITIASPLVMTFAVPTSSFWTSGFIANCINAAGVDVLFTTGNLLITGVFPQKEQALAGGVFNTVSQIGKAIGVALAAVVAGSTTANSSYADKASPEALMYGYHAAFWYCSGLSIVTLIVGLWGLRKVGKVGHKND